MLFALSLHIAFLLIWSAALLYFPFLLVRQVEDDGIDSQLSAIHMQRTLYAYVMTPSALLAVGAGIWLIFERGFIGGWLHVKLALVLLMVFFHVYCGSEMDKIRRGEQRRTSVVYRIVPIVPALLITAIITLVSAKPF